MAVKCIYESSKNFYNQVEQITKKDPVAAVINSLAMKILSIFVCVISNNLGVGIFLLSLTFDIAIIRNLEDVCAKIKNKFLDVVKGEVSEKGQAKKIGSSIRIYFYKIENYIRNCFEGFFEGFYTDFK